MRDITSLSKPQLDARVRDGIARRLDAQTTEDSARAGADLLAVLREIRRREAARRADATHARQRGRAGRDGRTGQDGQARQAGNDGQAGSDGRAGQDGQARRGGGDGRGGNGDLRTVSSRLRT